MLHFPDQKSNFKSKFEKTVFLKNVDLDNVTFYIKIADFGYSKKLQNQA